ncbi:MAG: PKD domain-containing protein [Saprospiraceae bacterium]|nr:PKD domain-containing protein [Saprospiraceae bacterium]MCF8249283.1 PKD domain-containing protein [Saprospiraceae bacterium]MCF8279704.1 PKD domain-containing protein [Bacteroidales bacterium]MCF8311440.1 PKD domain-containing protein [Saprospiraceae bacterium]MCF8439902.1 PKD domain-containing protein [Saprospiraceae bacterium]
MNTYIWTLLLTFITLPIFSQSQIFGIINQYAKVTAIEPCEAKLTVSDGSFFGPGGKVLVIQMKGANINTSNSGSFGNIDDVGSAGFYEINEVLSVLGNDIYLKNELLHFYGPASSVQLVTVPEYANVDAVGEVKAKPWDGSTGGVLILEATNLNLQASIDVSGTGFRGAQQVEVVSDCSFFTNADAFSYSTTNWRGSPKGEGIANLVQDKEHGRGAQANGGGGGNDHNSGGGGGGNIVDGGIGGKQSVGGFGCDGDYPGRGGKACPIQAGRIFLGGGGGAGHFDDTGAGSSGANGGGIAIIIAQTIEANGFSILANGMKPPIAHGDGAGGGGAGGTILLKTNSILGVLSIEAKGGGGGDVINNSDRCNGAGGGGSGGRLLANTNNFAQVNLDGGPPGVNTVASGQCNGPSNGAEEGEIGLQSNLSAIPTAQNEIQQIEILQQPTDVFACVGLQVDITFQVQGNYLEYQWQLNSGAGWGNVPIGPNYAGALSHELTIFNVVPAMDGFQYRCLVSSPCIADFYSDEVSLVLTGLPAAAFDIVPIGNGSYEFQNNSANSTSFLWDFGDGNTSIEPNPTHTYSDFGDYTVTLVATGPCGDDELTINLNVAVLPTADFSFQNAGFCAPQTVTFTNLSSSNAESFEWILPGGTPSTFIGTTPMVTYNQAGIFDVTLIAFNSVGSDTFSLSQVIEIGGPPVANFGFSVANLTVSFDNLSLNGNNGFLWDFGDGVTSDEENPIHTFDMQGLFQVSLTAFNDCGQVTITLTVPTGSLPLANFMADFTTGCNPMTVHFQNQSSGSNLSGYSWEFPGGTPAFSNEENPVVTYDQPGLYQVNLTTTSPFGSHAISQPDYVKVYLTPIANFDFLQDGQIVYFNNSSVGGTYYHWDFGDGNTSSGVNPVHEYTIAGVFDVELTTSTLNCGSAISNQVFIEPSATKEPGQPIEIAIFPNPTAGFCIVNLGRSKHQPIKIRLLDSLGRQLQSFDIQNDTVKLSFADYPAGLYFVEVSSEGFIRTKKLMKL